MPGCAAHAHPGASLASTERRTRSRMSDDGLPSTSAALGGVNAPIVKAAPLTREDVDAIAKAAVVHTGPAPLFMLIAGILGMVAAPSMRGPGLVPFFFAIGSVALFFGSIPVFWVRVIRRGVALRAIEADRRSPGRVQDRAPAEAEARPLLAQQRRDPPARRGQARRRDARRGVTVPRAGATSPTSAGCSSP